MNKRNRQYVEDRVRVLADRQSHGLLTREQMAEAVELTEQLDQDDARKNANSDIGGYGPNGRTMEDEAFSRYLRTGDTHGLNEVRAGTGLSTAPTGSGQTGADNAGYQVPQGFWQQMTVALKAYGGLSNGYRLVETKSGAPMPWPTVDPTGVTATLIAQELTQMSVTSPYVFGQGTLQAWTYATPPLLASVQLLNDSEFDVDGFVAERLGEAIGRSLAAAAVSGTGSGQPLGLVTALNAKGSAGTVGGSSTASGGFVTLATAASVKTFQTPAGGTELVQNVLSPATCLAMVSAVDSAYWPECAWWMSPQQALNQHGVIDAQGRPLLNYSEGMEDGAVGSILGFPVYTDPNLPALTASTTGGPVFGSLNRAMVYRRVNDVSVMRLQDRFADYLAVGYIGFLRADFRSNDLRSAVTVKPAAT